jgi:polyphosphate kinase
VLDPGLRQRVIDECLQAYLHDGRDAWDLQPDGSYRRVEGAEEPRGHGAQAALLERYAAPPGDEEVRQWT